ncbi:MAG: tRNA (adenosine(37)-N6)-threonylcarbamoyltransferase complex transferase subunit TsaD [Alphaproteobacteria bacterium RIFCSPLOWO2_01_FULL_40_26]|nr:MAG: tRNA (adenosine(37)-N6)-threonylcarbamoyltransferase complex transferase subunit TsaD [Alphaproteobacteria bacterium RIFCSPHIGHO2_02_FULL_40_34]OFW87555.1 MAG: tRNA (adenosine(37)-N6)-threonylcarbamoyltransferase complex transferase subunit TsaD [Alphaproteobacteria bacterium RIFCSPHIGHO2_01_FULL_40_8]OFW94487.1 MAG: tRNA (adenosine(37)-N6)-threonylcarbamoyltransferase complex transferase subunit TsaD [Alphaproteobacteria bacterium RIFCSPLOWO2_01_FULL_40_26]OFX10198.1 MAG: tRNA (adenosin
MKILGIETSCDETAVAIVDDAKNILSHVLKSQIDLHKKYGGVVPELAARGHVEVLDEMILQALRQANLKFEEIDGFAATCGPGLIGGVIVGMMAAKTLASIYQKPFLAVNHLEAHALTVRLTNDLQFPYLLLLISGGHCQILFVRDVGDYEKFGETIDDALGEAFDKIAQMLDLPYPGGPAVEKMAVNGEETRFKFSRPLLDSKNENHRFNFSFSGLKTAVRRQIEKLTGEEFSHTTSPKKLSKKDKADICASFQHIVCEIITNRLDNLAIKQNSASGIFRASVILTNEARSTKHEARKSTANYLPLTTNLVIAGGVAANRYIFSRLQNWAKNHGLEIITPPVNLCTDNAAMVAWAGVEKLKLGKCDDLNFKPRAKWELMDLDLISRLL